MDNIRQSPFFNVIYPICVCVLLGISLIMQYGEWNRDVFLFINQHSKEYFGDIFPAYMTVLGESMILLTWATVFLIYYPQHSKTALYSALAAAFLINGLKRLFNAPRPPFVLDSAEFQLIGDKLSHLSFPSGHTAAAFTFAGIIMLSGSRYLSVIALIYAVMIGWSRMAVGVHWPGDVFGGAALALFVVWMIDRFFRNDFSKFGNRLTGLLLAAIATAGNLFTSEGFDDIRGIVIIRMIHAGVAFIILLYFVYMLWQDKKRNPGVS